MEANKTKRRSPEVRKMVIDGVIRIVYPRSRERVWMRLQAKMRGIEILRATRLERRKYRKKLTTNCTNCTN